MISGSVIIKWGESGSIPLTQGRQPEEHETGFECLAPAMGKLRAGQTKERRETSIPTPNPLIRVATGSLVTRSFPFPVNPTNFLPHLQPLSPGHSKDF
jgi:hypothetical protein